MSVATAGSATNPNDNTVVSTTDQNNTKCLKQKRYAKSSRY